MGRSGVGVENASVVGAHVDPDLGGLVSLAYGGPHVSHGTLRPHRRYEKAALSAD